MWVLRTSEDACIWRDVLAKSATVDVIVEKPHKCYDLKPCVRDFRIYITRSRLRSYEGLPYIHVQTCVMYRVDINSRKSLHYPPPRIASSRCHYKSFLEF